MNMIDLINIRRADISVLVTKFGLKLDLTLPLTSLKTELQDRIEKRTLKKAARDHLLALVEERMR